MSEDQTSTMTRWAIRLPAFVALAASAVMLRASMEPGAGIPGCAPGGVFDCESVLTTRWAYWFGVPVSALAVLLHSLVIVATVQLHPSRDPDRQRRAWTVLVAFAVTVAAAACWFLGLQIAMRSHWCLYCIIAHAAGLVVCAVVLMKAPIVPGPSIATGAVAGIILVAGQMFGPPPPATAISGQANIRNFDTGPGPTRLVGILATDTVPPIGFNPNRLPMIGSPDAKRIVVYLFDYTCVHCRSLHRMLDEVQPRFGDQLGIVLLPVPLDSDCNPHVKETEPIHEHACEYARLAMAVFNIDRTRFSEFDHYLTEGEQWPSPEDARRKAESLVDPVELAHLLSEPGFSDQFGFFADVLQRTQVPRLPQIVFGSMTISGRPNSADQLANDLARELNLTPVQPTEQKNAKE